MYADSADVKPVPGTRVQASKPDYVWSRLARAARQGICPCLARLRWKAPSSDGALRKRAQPMGSAKRHPKPNPAHWRVNWAFSSWFTVHHKLSEVLTLHTRTSSSLTH